MSRKTGVETPARTKTGQPHGSHLAEAKRSRATIDVRRHRDGHIEVHSTGGGEQTDWLSRVEIALGTHGSAFACATVKELISVAKNSAGEIDNEKINAMIAMIDGAKPRNEIEASVAVQMAMVHFATLTV